MFCSNCGEALGNEDNFCKKCGTHTASGTQDIEEAHEKTEMEIMRIHLSEEDTKKINRKATIYSILIALGFIALLIGLFFGFVYYSACSSYAPENTSFLSTIKHCSENEKAAVENNFGSFNPFQANEEVVRKNEEFLSNLQSEFGVKGLLFDVRSQSPISSTYRIYTAIFPTDDSENAKTLLRQYNEEIVATLTNAEIPNSLVNNLVMGLISPTFEGGRVAVLRNGGVTRYELPKKSAHGIAFTSSDNSAIFIFGTALGDSFRATLLHEIGHLLSVNFTSADWIEWAKIRNAPSGFAFSEWESSAKEDFAEEFKRYANNYQGGQSFWENNTAWNTDYSWMFSNNSSKEASKEVQDFIKKHLFKYQEEEKRLEARKQEIGEELKRLEEMINLEETHLENQSTY